MYIHNHTHIVIIMILALFPILSRTAVCTYPPLQKKNIRIQPTATGYRIKHQLWNQQTYSGWWLMMVNIRMVYDG